MAAPLWDEKITALAQFLHVKPEQIGKEYDEYRVGDKSFKVFTDSEADTAFESALDDYLEQIIWPELPEAYQMYFDEEAWKRDARINSCRGNELSWYDGREEEVQVNGTWYYIYRTN